MMRTVLLLLHIDINDDECQPYLSIKKSDMALTIFGML